MKVREGSALIFSTHHTRENQSDSSYEDLIQELLDDEMPAVKKASAAKKIASVPAYADYAVSDSD